MSESVWRKGPPPSIGWWPASNERSCEPIRWWNGRFWSKPAYADFNAKEAARSAAIEADYQWLIEWTDRPASWPERSKT